jgi:hypothetical protein
MCSRAPVGPATAIAVDSPAAIEDANVKTPASPELGLPILWNVRCYFARGVALRKPILFEHVYVWSAGSPLLLRVQAPQPRGLPPPVTLHEVRLQAIEHDCIFLYGKDADGSKQVLALQLALPQAKPKVAQSRRRRGT